MSSPSTASVPAPRHAAPDDVVFRTARRWAVGVLAVATVGLAAYLALLSVGVWMVAFALGAVTGRPTAGVDVLAVVADALPALLAGWCIGLATVAALGRARSLGPRTSGLAAGALGTAAGAAVLGLAGLL